jgi:hypothetical protein
MPGCVGAFLLHGCQSVAKLPVLPGIPQGLLQLQCSNDVDSNCRAFVMKAGLKRVIHWSLLRLVQQKKRLNAVELILYA